MLTASTDSVEPVLNRMIHCCREINHLLLQDIIYLSKDDLDSIESNNKMKTDILNELISLEQSLQNHNLHDRPELIDIMSQLKIEITHCFKSMVINNNIINVNLNQLRSIWDKLLVRSEVCNNLYDKHGSTSK